MQISRRHSPSGQLDYGRDSFALVNLARPKSSSTTIGAPAWSLAQCGDANNF